MGLTTKVPALGQVRSLVYPEGFGAGKDGGLRVVPGGHLYRQARLEPNSDECASARSLTTTQPLPPSALTRPLCPAALAPVCLSESRRLRRPPEDWTQDDEVFAAEWLAGKTHPITGEPLEIVELELPPGSIVSCLSVRSLFNS